MQEIRYVIQDELGIHARPAGQLVKLCTGFPCAIQIGGPEKSVDAKRIMGVMGLGLKRGQELTMTFTGEREEEAAEALTAFLKENL